MLSKLTLLELILCLFIQSSEVNLTDLVTDGALANTGGWVISLDQGWPLPENQMKQQKK